MKKVTGKQINKDNILLNLPSPPKNKPGLINGQNISNVKDEKCIKNILELKSKEFVRNVFNNKTCIIELRERKKYIIEHINHQYSINLDVSINDHDKIIHEWNKITSDKLYKFDQFVFILSNDEKCQININNYNCELFITMIDILQKYVKIQQLYLLRRPYEIFIQKCSSLRLLCHDEIITSTNSIDDIPRFNLPKITPLSIDDFIYTGGKTKSKNTIELTSSIPLSINREIDEKSKMKNGLVIQNNLINFEEQLNGSNYDTFSSNINQYQGVSTIQIHPKSDDINSCDIKNYSTSQDTDIILSNTETIDSTPIKNHSSSGIDQVFISEHTHNKMEIDDTTKVNILRCYDDNNLIGSAKCHSNNEKYYINNENIIPSNIVVEKERYDIKEILNTSTSLHENNLPVSSDINNTPKDECSEQTSPCINDDTVKEVESPKLRMISKPFHTGMNNNYSICYLNSVIQSLFAIQSFCNLITKGIIFVLFLVYNYFFQDYTNSCPFFIHLYNIYREVSQGNYDYIDMNSFATLLFTATHLEPFIQQDAHEFYILLIDILSIEVNNIVNQNPNLNFIKIDFQSMFYGSMQYSTLCDTCRNVSYTSEKFNCMSISLENDESISSQSTSSDSYQQDLINCLNNYFTPETIPLSSGWICEKCKTNRIAIKNQYIQSLPLLLCIHLGRIASNGDKINNNISFSLDGFDYKFPFLSNYLNETKFNYKYTLKSIVFHYGISVTSGHYNSLCKHIINEPTTSNPVWIKYDDKLVEQFDITKGFFSHSTYLLFYEL